MEITELEFEEAGILAPFYNRLAKDVPFSFPVTEEQFAMGLLWQSDDHSHHERLHNQHLLVCLRASEAVGFAHIAIERWKGLERGVIRFIGCAPGDRMTGQRLLHSAERLLSDLGMTEILAFPPNYGYPFHQKATGTLSGWLPHILGLLGANAYVIAPHPPFLRSEDLLFDWPDYEVPRPASPDKGLSVDMDINGGNTPLPKATFRLVYGDEVVGESETWPVGRWTRADAAQDLFAISIDIGEKWQGRGWGSYLMRRGLWEMRQLGYRRSALGTNLANYPAISLYANLGYKAVGTAYSFVKQLT